MMSVQTQPTEKDWCVSGDDPAKLQAEIIRLKAAHALELRRLEIASYKAELEMATRLRNAGLRADVVTVHNKDSSVLLYSDRSALGKKLFRRNGRPTRLLRAVVFSASGKPRGLTRRLAFKKDGTPRAEYREWLESAAYQCLPEAYKKPKA